MTTLSRHASAARLLLDLTALSVKEPTRDRCVRPPSHHRAMCIFRPRDLVNSRAQDSHLCTRLSLATSASVVTLVRVVLSRRHDCCAKRRAVELSRDRTY